MHYPPLSGLERADGAAEAVLVARVEGRIEAVPTSHCPSTLSSAAAALKWHVAALRRFGASVVISDLIPREQVAQCNVNRIVSDWCSGGGARVILSTQVQR